MSIWLRHLLTDWHITHDQSLKKKAFALASSRHGRMTIEASSPVSETAGIFAGMTVADARAVFPALLVMDYKEELTQEILDNLAKWCLRFTPEVAVDPPDSLMLDISGCPHLWGGEGAYLKVLVLKLRAMGYDCRAAIADTIGAAWAVAHYGKVTPLIEAGKQKDAITSLPPEALRLDPFFIDRLHKLGLYTVGSFMDMPRQTLRRRFGQQILTRLDQVLGTELEIIRPIRPTLPYQEWLPSLEPIRTARGIEIAIKNLLERLCQRLCLESRGVRSVTLTCHRIDKEIQEITINTGRPSRDPRHLYKLLELKIPSIEPALGIELFLMEAGITEELTEYQQTLWKSAGEDEKAVAELVDRIAGKVGPDKIHRYLPQEQHWPERSYKEAASIREKADTTWRTDRLRPICLLAVPEKIEVSFPVPDYPPMLFIHKGKTHRIVKADGPERIEQQWWLENGLHRDYYCAEDEGGARYWLFRSGHFFEEKSAWFLHGYFA